MNLSFYKRGKNSGETIDFGPCAFMEGFHPKCVFSSIDQNGRYAWGNQGNIGFWNLTRFAETLLPLIDEKEETAATKAEAVLAKFPERFDSEYSARLKAKLALPDHAPNDIVKGCLELLAQEETDFTLFFRRLTQFAKGGTRSPLESLFRDPADFKQWHSDWEKQANLQNGTQAMATANPIRIPRNHRVEQAIQAAYRQDYAPFHRLVEALEEPYHESEYFSDIESLPKPHEVVEETFCGT